MTPTYDLSAFAAELAKWRPLAGVKNTMLEAIANIAVAVQDNDTELMAQIQCDLMWCYNIFDTIKEKGGEL